MARGQIMLHRKTEPMNRQKYSALYVGIALVIMNATDLLGVLYMAK